MNIKKPLLVLGAVTGIGLAGVTGLGVASAATNTGGTDSIIDRISTKFNLNKDEVKAVFEEERAIHEVERQQEAEQRLTQAVTDGKITEEQKAKVLAKLEELKSNREDWQDKTSEEHREAMKELHQTLKQWAKDNDIPMRYLHLGMVRGHGKHFEGQ